MLRPHIEGRSFKIRTDHNDLRWILNMADATGKLSKLYGMSRIRRNIRLVSCNYIGHEDKYRRMGYIVNLKVSKRTIRRSLLTGRISHSHYTRVSVLLRSKGISRRTESLDGSIQKLIPTGLRGRILYLSHYTVMEEHPVSRRMYDTIRQ